MTRKPILSLIQLFNVPQAVACDDGVHFCPSGTTCCTMNQNLIEVDEVFDNVGCCAVEDAVCCNDGVNCCPRGYECINSGNIRCRML